jgi:RNA polymerase sigma-70 factor (ECF subfamily)
VRDLVAGGKAEAADTHEITAEALCRSHSQRVCRFAAMVAGTELDAGDLAQEALLRAIRSLRHFDPERGSIDAWLWRIVVNCARDAGRIQRRRLMLLERLRLLPLRPVPSAEAQALARIRDAELLSEIRRSPARDRALIALRYGAGLDHAEVARALGISTAAATRGTSRALSRLRRRLEADR